MTNHEVLIKKMSDVVDAGLVRLLNEDEFKSYPADIVKLQIERHFNERFGDDVYFMEIVPDSDKDVFNDIQMLILTTDHPEFKSGHIDEQIDKILRRSGWYIGDTATDGKVVQFSLEPRYPITNDRITEFSTQTICRLKMFYHVTFKKYLDRIMRNGLQPSFTKRQEFYHPERIYLFGDFTLATAFLDYQSNNTALQTCIATRKVGNTGKTADIKYQDNTRGCMVMLKVNLKQMLDDGGVVKLYHDNRWDADSPVFFTQNSINPKYLKLAITEDNCLFST